MRPFHSGVKNALKNAEWWIDPNSKVVRQFDARELQVFHFVSNTEFSYCFFDNFKQVVDSSSFCFKFIDTLLNSDGISQNLIALLDEKWHSSTKLVNRAESLRFNLWAIAYKFQFQDQIDQRKKFKFLTNTLRKLEIFLNGKSKKKSWEDAIHWTCPPGIEFFLQILHFFGETMIEPSNNIQRILNAILEILTPCHVFEHLGQFHNVKRWFLHTTMPLKIENVFKVLKFYEIDLNFSSFMKSFFDWDVADVSVLKHVIAYGADLKLIECRKNTTCTTFLKKNYLEEYQKLFNIVPNVQKLQCLACEATNVDNFKTFIGPFQGPSIAKIEKHVHVHKKQKVDDERETILAVRNDGKFYHLGPFVGTSYSMIPLRNYCDCTIDETD